MARGFCLWRLRYQSFIKIRQTVNHLPSQHDRANDVIEVQYGKERFSAPDEAITGVSCGIADFADIVNALHQVFAVYETGETLIGG